MRIFSTRTTGKRRWWVWVLVGVAVAAGFYGWARPRQFREIGVVSGFRPVGTAAGVLVRECPTVYGQNQMTALYGWTSGQVRWGLPLPPDQSDGYRPALISDISPDGQTFAAGTVGQGYLRRVRVWRAGMLQEADVALPVDAALRASQDNWLGTDFPVLRALPDGAVLCCLPEQAGFRLLLIEQGRVTARGRLASAVMRRVNGSGYSVDIAQDGRLLAVQSGYWGTTAASECFELSRQGARLTGLLRAPKNRNAFTELLDDGIDYDQQRGKQSFGFPGGRRQPASLEVLALSGRHGAAGRYVLDVSTPGRYRVFSPARGEAWTFGLPGGNYAMQDWTVTPDGRYVLMLASKHYPQGLVGCVDRLFGWSDIPSLLYSRSILLLYERPGRLRAATDIGTITYRHHGWVDGTPCLALSPDGRTAAVGYSFNQGPPGYASGAGTVLLGW